MTASTNDTLPLLPTQAGIEELVDNSLPAVMAIAKLMKPAQRTGGQRRGAATASSSSTSVPVSYKPTIWVSFIDNENAEEAKLIVEDNGEDVIRLHTIAALGTSHSLPDPSVRQGHAGRGVTELPDRGRDILQNPRADAR